MNEGFDFDVKKKIIRFKKSDLEYIERHTKNSSHFIRVLVSKIVTKMKEREADGKEFEFEL